MYCMRRPNPGSKTTSQIGLFRCTAEELTHWQHDNGAQPPIRIKHTIAWAVEECENGRDALGDGGQRVQSNLFFNCRRETVRTVTARAADARWPTLTQAYRHQVGIRAS